MESPTRSLDSFGMCACAFFFIFTSNMNRIFLLNESSTKGVSMCPRKTQHHLDGCSLDCLAFLYFHIIYAGCFNVFFFLVLLLPSLSFSSLPVCALFIHIFLRIHQTTGAFAPCVFFSICGIIYSMWCGRLLKCSRSVVCSVTQNINYNIAFTPAVHLSRWLFCVLKWKRRRRKAERGLRHQRIYLCSISFSFVFVPLLLLYVAIWHNSTFSNDVRRLHRE